MCVLSNSRSTQENALPPLTSFDWSSQNNHKLGTASIDTTCTIWNLEKQKVETQLIAHDKAVYDIAFSASHDNLFSSVGADGSVRLFDQRNLDHSTIIYESDEPLLRLSWNRRDTNILAAMAQDVAGAIVLDIRKPSVALSFLTSHESYLNAMCWADRNHIVIGGNDGHILIYDVRESLLLGTRTARESTVPTLSYLSEHSVSQIAWMPGLACIGHSTGVDMVSVPLMQ